MQNLEIQQHLISQLKPVMDDKEDSQTTLQRLFRTVCDIFNAQPGIMLFDPHDEELILQSPAFQASDDAIHLYRIRPSQQGNASRVFVTGRAYYSNQALGDQNIIQEFVHLYNVRNIATVPIEGNEKRMGVLHLINRKDRDWREEDLLTLSWIASQIGYILENAHLLRQISNQRALAERATLQLQQQNQVIIAQRKNLEEQRIELENSLSLHHHFTNLLLSGQGVSGILKTLASKLHCSTLLIDPYQRVLAVELNSIELQQEQMLSPGQFMFDTTGWIKLSVKQVGQTFGYLLLPSTQTSHLGQWEKLLIEQAKLALCVELMYQKIMWDTQNKRKAELLEQLIQGEFAEVDSLLKEALIYGHNLSSEHIICVFQQPEGESKNMGESEGIDLFHHLETYLANRQLTCLVLKQMDHIVLMVNLSQIKKSTVSSPQQLIQFLLKRVFTQNYRIGISRPCNHIHQYAKAYNEALKAVKLAHSLKKTIVEIDEFRSLEMLLDLSSETSYEFISHVLEPLLNHDRIQGSKLLFTLSAYLESNGVLTQTAERCYSHINTVRYRLARIEELLECDLKNNQTLFDLQLALKLLTLWGENSGFDVERGKVRL
jgi:DNA-binding PucR family transcriptional regulator